jgi:hypothetical protein
MTFALFEDGKPARITEKEFLRYHLQQFPKLNEPGNSGVFDEASSTVYTMFSGVATIWDNHPKDDYYEKTVTCYRLLIAWYIADQYPRLLRGLPVMGGVPMKRTKIGPVDLTFADSAVTSASGQFKDLLSQLKSNPFGNKAYMMITTAAKRARVVRS